ncbi:hypothetical protein [Methanosarcina horonobensis]|nr:hypothetical protein [Methanosarcina horonobensis]
MELQIRGKKRVTIENMREDFMAYPDSYWTTDEKRGNGWKLTKNW